MPDSTCRSPGCGKTYGSASARALHEISHREQQRRPCPVCQRPTSTQFMDRHMRKHGSTRRVTKKTATKPSLRIVSKRRSLGSILEELYDAVAWYEKEHERLQVTFDRLQSQMLVAQKAFESATTPTSAKPPRL